MEVTLRRVQLRNLSAAAIAAGSAAMSQPPPEPPLMSYGAVLLHGARAATLEDVACTDVRGGTNSAGWACVLVGVPAPAAAAPPVEARVQIIRSTFAGNAVAAAASPAVLNAAAAGNSTAAGAAWEAAGQLLAATAKGSSGAAGGAPPPQGAGAVAVIILLNTPAAAAAAGSSIGGSSTGGSIQQAVFVNIADSRFDRNEGVLGAVLFTGPNMTVRS